MAQTRILFEKQHKFFGKHYAKEQILAEYRKRTKKVQYWHLIEILNSDYPDDFSDAYQETPITKATAKKYLKQAERENKENAIKQELLKSVSISDLELKIEIK